MAGNRCGKTTAGAYETTLHLTGRYPDWWEGRRLDCPIEAWVAGLTSSTTRDIVQLELLGRFGEFGTGMIPFHALKGYTLKRRPAHAVDTVAVAHATGGTSMLGFKAYREGAAAFQGTVETANICWRSKKRTTAGNASVRAAGARTARRSDDLTRLGDLGAFRGFCQLPRSFFIS